MVWGLCGSGGGPVRVFENIWCWGIRDGYVSKGTWWPSFILEEGDGTSWWCTFTPSKALLHRKGNNRKEMADCMNSSPGISGQRRVIGKLWGLEWFRAICGVKRLVRKYPFLANSEEQKLSPKNLSWTSGKDVRATMLLFCSGFGGPDRSFWPDIRRNIRPKTSSLGCKTKIGIK